MDADLSRTALGVVVPGAIIAFLWAIGGCLGFFGSMGALLLGSFGVGAILVKVLNLGSQSAAVPSPAGGPVGEAPIPPGEGASAPDTGVAQPSVAEPAAAVVETPASELASSEPAASETPAAQAEQWWVSASGVQESAAPPAAASTPPAGQVDPEIVQAGDLAQADFTRIEGIGPKLSQRLHAANVHTFADLAALPPETAAGVLGWTSERLLRLADFGTGQGTGCVKAVERTFARNIWVIPAPRSVHRVRGRCFVVRQVPPAPTP